MCQMNNKDCRSDYNMNINYYHSKGAMSVMNTYNLVCHHVFTMSFMKCSSITMFSQAVLDIKQSKINER